MKLESITVENYRQFEKAELTFDEGITILAGANNSGKTSLINLIKNIFVDDKLNYNMSDIPAKNMREWVEWVYPIFQKFFRDRKTEENVEKDLLNVVIPKEETDSTHLMKMTTVKIHVSYNPDMDDIKLFADCIMDLDETKHDFYFMYNFEIVHTQFAREIINNFSKIKHRFAEIEEKKSQYAETTDELIINNIQVKERYLKQLIVSLYIQATIPNVYFCDEDYKNKCKFDETKKFRQLFNFCFIKASRPLDDDESDHSHMLSKQMIKMVKMDEKWNELVESLPDEVLKPIQEKEIDKAIRSTSLESLKDTIATLEQTNGGKSGELMLDMQISEEDISDLLQRITTATYDIDFVMTGYKQKCAITGNVIQYKSFMNLEAAHIWPRSHKGLYLPSNGIALCRDMHWAFDKGMFTIGDDFKVIVHPDVESDYLQQYNNKSLYIPENAFFRPDINNLHYHQTHIYVMLMNFFAHCEKILRINLNPENWKDMKWDEIIDNQINEENKITCHLRNKIRSC